MAKAKFSFWKELLAKISNSGPMTRGLFGGGIFSALRLEPLLLPKALAQDFAGIGVVEGDIHSLPYWGTRQQLQIAERLALWLGVLNGSERD